MRYKAGRFEQHTSHEYRWYDNGARSFFCRCCGAESYSEDDIRNAYCGRCHAQHTPEGIHEQMCPVRHRLRSAGLTAEEAERVLDATIGAYGR